ncbi:hypothetical protein [Subtercola boreus]|uniref:hypothetical protein n=1 Tax=Subtercola boreus TaxID=120213 RepID=UPI00114F64EC|nr:hypothetical protein [Subtercola boreus]
MTVSLDPRSTSAVCELTPPAVPIQFGFPELDVAFDPSSIPVKFLTLDCFPCFVSLDPTMEPMEARVRERSYLRIQFDLTSPSNADFDLCQPAYLADLTALAPSLPPTMIAALYDLPENLRLLVRDTRFSVMYRTRWINNLTRQLPVARQLSATQVEPLLNEILRYRAALLALDLSSPAVIEQCRKETHLLLTTGSRFGAAHV